MHTTTHEILAKVVETEHYAIALDRGLGMCWALGRAVTCGMINIFECECTRDDVAAYVTHLSPKRAWLWKALEDKGMPHFHDDLIAIYRDWDNRPFNNETFED